MEKTMKGRSYVLATITLLASLGTANGNCLKAKKSQKQDEETVAAPTLPEAGNGTDAGKGADHLREISAKAAEALRSRGVMSRAFPGRSVADVIPSEILTVLPVIEHVDSSKMRREGSGSAVRAVLSFIGRKGSGSYSASQSRAGAHGLFQLMPQTYSGIRRKHPDAGLILSFSEGMRNEVNAAMAVYLLLDESLAGVEKNRRQTLVQSPETFRKFLAAAYNAGYPRAVSALRSENGKTSWLTFNHWELPRETRGYLWKLGWAYPEIAG